MFLTRTLDLVSLRNFENDRADFVAFWSKLTAIKGRSLGQVRSEIGLYAEEGSAVESWLAVLFLTLSK